MQTFLNRSFAEKKCIEEKWNYPTDCNDHECSPGGGKHTDVFQRMRNSDETLCYHGN